MTFIRGKIRIYANDKVKKKYVQRKLYISTMCLKIIKGASKTVSRKSALTPNLPQENSAGAQPGAKFELLATNITRNK